MPTLDFGNIDSFLVELKSRYPTYSPPGSEAFVELQQLLDDLCVLYLGVPEEQRAQIRNLAAELPSPLRNQLLNHVGWARERIRSPKDEQWLRRGLAAASIEDNHLDHRDMFIALGGLYLAASSVGINCSPYFREAAELSSTRPGLFPLVGSMRDFLANFEQSAYFKSDVRPKIGKYLSPRVRNEILAVLADIWDPLQVKNGKYPRSEYGSYVDDIYELLVKDATDAQITEHLCRTAQRRMEMEPPPSTPNTVRALRAVRLGEN